MRHLFNFKKLLLISVFLLLPACLMEQADPQKTPAELMALQTRDFDTSKEQAIGGV
jgi:outer membrane biogenesis lipoprotein LolB